MSAPSVWRRRPVPEEPGPAGVLYAIATMLDEVSPWGIAPQLVRLVADSLHDDEFDLGIRPLTRDDGPPFVALAGFRAPHTWQAIGVVCEGTARAMGAAPPPGSVTPGDRVRVVHLVERTGRGISTLRADAADEPVVTEWDGDDATALGGSRGAIDDACRRALGLSTAPPDAGTVELFAVMWLHDVLREAAGAAGRRRFAHWDELASRHPVYELLANEPVTTSTADLPWLGQRLSERMPWSRVRALCATSGGPMLGVPPAWADWLDDGAFSRLARGGLPDLPDVAAAVIELVPVPVGDQVRSVLDAWGIGRSVPH
jgi:hypothetical protein